ncbi:response regulator transcription factor [Acidocella sp.]|jgi:two-component system OmpR family response regulator|uniref:response regulator transcription factor n=1 Tax=Acidocella sp. TaxID=50710 RepID=UPI002F4037E6
MRILLVEDEPDLGAAVQGHVREAGHAVDWFENLAASDAAMRTVAYDLLLLDLHLPDGNGLDFLRALRARRDAIPVVILTARDQISDRIEGLSAGADDYLVKPFDLDELIARLNAAARLEGVEVELTAREWAVLGVLVRRPNATVSREQIEDALYAFEQEIESNAIEVYISRIRRKLGRDFVRTTRGLGYRIRS